MRKTVYSVNYPLGLSYLFSPGESRFILHMLFIETRNRYGYNIKLSKSGLRKRMNLNEYTFNRTVKKLKEMELLSVTYNKKGTRICYAFNLELYDKLVAILSVTNEPDRLLLFCESKFRKGKRSIESITPAEIKELKTGIKPP